MCVGSDGGALNTAHNAESPPALMTPDEWDIAACRYHPKELFFPDRNNYWQVWERARTICNTCPVKQACAQDGAHEVFGMWGGLTPRDASFTLGANTEDTRIQEAAMYIVFANAAPR